MEDIAFMLEKFTFEITDIMVIIKIYVTDMVIMKNNLTDIMIIIKIYVTDIMVTIKNNVTDTLW